MLGWLLLGAVIGAALVIAVAYLSKSVAAEKVRPEISNAKKLLVKSIVKDGSTNRVKMSALDDYDNNIREVEFEADEVSYDIYEGQKIYI